MCHAALQELAKLRIEVHKREEMIREKKQFLESQENNNTEMDKKISLAERNAARLRLEFQEKDMERVRFADEVGQRSFSEAVMRN